MNFKLLPFLLVLVFSIFTAYSSQIYNEGGDFSVFLEKQSELVYNDDIRTSFSFTVENLQENIQSFTILLPEIKGWDISTNSEIFVLEKGENREVKVNFVANSNFDYSENLVGPDIIKISQKEDYKGYFEFPVMLVGDSENLTMKFQLEIEKREVLPVDFDVRFSTTSVSPIYPLRYTVDAQNVVNPSEVDISLVLDGKILQNFNDVFTSTNNYKIYEYEVPSDLSPGEYLVELRITPAISPNRPWVGSVNMEVEAYENLVTSKQEENTFFVDTYTVEIENRGNIESTYEERVDVSWFKSLFLVSENDYKRENGVIVFSQNLDRGETSTIEYGYNYISLYLILVAILILAVYFYIRKNSNPLDVETKIYDVKKVVHEGVKSLKVRIGFENIKEDQIETLKIIFRMPSYLSIKENSFILVEPNHVLKGHNQYKLIWEFKKFERNDSRIIGFTLINKRGVLGDIRLPDVEIEVKVNGKIRKYYQSFPTVRG